ncbi:MAG: aldo/keto reductase, partial [Bacteroidales bacterium]|nr:aldo/keto reductase [Bacteroidales bacterium]
MKPIRNNRRQFIKNLSLAVLGTTALTKTSFALNTPSGTRLPRASEIMHYKTLGRTGFKVSDIASGAPNNETVLKAMLDAGVNFIDTGHAYGNGNNERLIGKVLQNYDRKKIFINSKLHSPEGFKSKADVIRRTNEALERLQTDYVDCMMIHSADNSKIVQDEAYHAGMEQLKKEGKVRSTGVSCHGSAWYKLPEETIDKVLLTAAETGKFDVFQMAYNFVNEELAEKVFEVCEKKNIGRAIIKSSPVQIYQLLEKAVARQEEQGKDPGEAYYAYLNRYKERAEKAKDFFRKYGATTDEELINAAIVYALQNPKAHTVCLDIRNLGDVKRYLALSGQTLQKDQAYLLKDYHEHFGFLNCRVGCNECEKACPHHLPVNHILRYNYYYQNKKDEKQAMKLYADLPKDKKADHCLECPGYCEEACPHGVSARQLMAMAH